MAIHCVPREDGGEAYVISSGGVWLVGAYATEEAARYAFQFTDEELVAIRDAALEGFEADRRLSSDITIKDLRAWRRDHPRRKEDEDG